MSPLDPLTEPTARRDGEDLTSETFDVVVVGAGSAGAVVAARLSEEPSCRVALLEAGGPPPPEELIPALAAALQLNPATDWMYTADPGRAGLGLIGGRMHAPRGKMLGGGSGINYMAYVRGHPGDFDAWAAGGATGWGYADVLPYFRKSEGLAPSDDIVIDAAAHNTEGPLGVAVRAPLLPAATEFVDAAMAAGIPRGDHNGRDRGGPAGVVSLAQINTRNGRRSSTYHAFLEGTVEQRPNLTILTGARATRLLLDGTSDEPVVTGVEYRTDGGETRSVHAVLEVVLSAGAIGSPHLLMLSGIGPREELEAAGVACLVDSPHVGKHLKDHLLLPLFFSAPGVGVPARALALAREPEAVREWEATGRGLLASTLADAVAFFSTGLGDSRTHDAQIGILPSGFTAEFWRTRLRMDPDEFLADPAVQLGPDAENLVLLPNLAKPRSEGEIVLRSADPEVHPDIRMNYYADPHDLATMVAIARRALEIVAHWPAEHELGPLQIPPFLAARHGHVEGAEPSDAVLEDLALHYSLTVYHQSSTTRIGEVVDPRLRVHGVGRLRIADTGIMPDIVSGNTNAAAIMIGEKAAELVATDHGLKLAEFVGPA
jgi:choline dehydrogenase